MTKLNESNQSQETTQTNDQEVETLDFNKPDYDFVPGATHEYRQQGPYIICYSCELQHALYIGIDKMLMGFDENGKPKIANKPR